jgi:hypothetical protein
MAAVAAETESWAGTDLILAIYVVGLTLGTPDLYHMRRSPGCAKQVGSHWLKATAATIKPQGVLEIVRRVGALGNIGQHTVPLH